MEYRLSRIQAADVINFYKTFLSCDLYSIDDKICKTWYFVTREYPELLKINITYFSF